MSKNYRIQWTSEAVTINHVLPLRHRNSFRFLQCFVWLFLLITDGAHPRLLKRSKLCTLSPTLCESDFLRVFLLQYCWWFILFWLIHCEVHPFPDPCRPTHFTRSSWAIYSIEVWFWTNFLLAIHFINSSYSFSCASLSR